MTNPHHLDIACVIHGDYYDFAYVEKLRNMVRRHLPCAQTFHVLTESWRSVPSDMIKHELIDWPDVQGRKSAWWYKMQLFRDDWHWTQVLYFDLDTIIIDDISWILNLDTKFFWSIRDFKYLWRAAHWSMNSSMMYFHSQRYVKIWDQFRAQDLARLRKTYRGDQDYLSHAIQSDALKFVDSSRVQSWRWQVYDGGIDPRTRRAQNPGQGSVIPTNTSVIVCHGTPKPHEIQDPVVDVHWR